MGFCFHIFPLRLDPVPLDELAERATGHLRHYLESLPVEQLVDLSDELLEEARRALAARSEHVRIALGGVGAAAERWGPEGDPSALAFTVEPGGGGGFVRRFALDEPGASVAVELARTGASEHKIEAALQARLEKGITFTVERVLGQPPLAVLAHGFLAAALAESVDGLLASADGGWDEALWPCTGKELARSFMRPEKALAEIFRRRAEAMLREVPGALAPFEPGFVCRVLDTIVASLVKDVNAVRGDEEKEMAAFDRALVRLDTARLLSTSAPVRERDLLLGAGIAAEPRGRPSSAFARLRPTPDEYQRWIAHLGEHLA